MGIGDWGLGIANPNPKSPIPIILIINKNIIKYNLYL